MWVWIQATLYTEVWWFLCGIHINTVHNITLLRVSQVLVSFTASACVQQSSLHGHHDSLVLYTVSLVKIISTGSRCSVISHCMNSKSSLKGVLLLLLCFPILFVKFGSTVTSTAFYLACSWLHVIQLVLGCGTVCRWRAAATELLHWHSAWGMYVFYLETT